MTQKIKATAQTLYDKSWALVQEAQACPHTIDAARGYILQAYKWAIRHEQLTLCDCLSGCMLQLNEINTRMDYCVEG